MNLYQDEPAQEPASDTELFDATEEFVDMKRRFTLVTAEEPIPSGDEDTEQPSIIETIADGTFPKNSLLTVRH